MSDTATREERRSALDDFASAQMAPDLDEAQLPAIAAPANLPQVFGAQQLVVHRDERRVLQRIRELAAAAGEEWYYRFPVKNKAKGTTDYVEGPTIKLANDIARIYGNCEVDCRATDLGTVVLYHARFIDLETGFALTRPFQQRKGAARMGSDTGRNEDAAFQIGASKAIRNVVVNALQTYSDFAFIEAKSAIIDKVGRDLPKWRERAVERIGSMTSLDRVEAVIGRPAKEWLAPDVARVIAMGKAINDGMASVDDTFPPLVNKVPDGLDKFANSGPEAGMTTADAALASVVVPEEDIVVRLMRVGTEPGEREERLGALDVSRTMFLDLYPEKSGSIDVAIKTVAELIRGEITAEKAQARLVKELAK